MLFALRSSLFALRSSLFVSVCLIGCDSTLETCSKDPSLPECLVDSGCSIPGELKYLTVLNSHNSTLYRGDCGNYERAVAFQLPAGAPAPGWVVQRVVVEFENWNSNPNLAQCLPGQSDALEFYELIGAVPTGGKAPLLYDCLLDPMQFDAQGEPIPFRNPHDNSIRYSIDYNGVRGARTDDGHFYMYLEARFYTVDEMDGLDPQTAEGAAYWLGQSASFSGGACSRLLGVTEDPPPFWGTEASVVREIDLTWDCCPNIAQTTVNFDTNCR